MAKSNSRTPEWRDTHARMIVELDAELYEAFKAAVAADDRTVASAVRKMVRDYVRNHEKRNQ